ncbi:S-layer family protein [Sulfuricurvum sp.]|uniref:beta strand repeat-containing protein n=1 Tax=Sulfuricurvum sp. TaxID=2025608 RepID=UPI002632E7BA|nr:DUF2235 domain-containing protein [Sulfuricurvum sp.]MDD4950697.1 DUF2235 domain-containing protein [Sulfuricurvum sp.]
MADTTTLPDGVSTIPVAKNIDTYTNAVAQIDQMNLPKIYDASNVNSRVFIALADGTENNVNDPKMGPATNIGILYNQLTETLKNNPNSNIGYSYKEGPGTQGGLGGSLDSGLGFSYDERAEELYTAFCKQAKTWLAENPNADISLGELGFSRGSGVIAKFNQLVEERGIIDPDSAVVSIDTTSADPTQWKQVTTYTKILQDPGTIAQAAILYDPVITGITSDLSLSPSTVAALQITAANEYRTLFPSMSLVAPGLSDDGKYLNVTVAGAHSDIGGGYNLNGLPELNFNMTASVLNTMLGQNIVQPLTLPTDEGMYVIHNSVEGEWFYTKTLNREIKYSDLMAGSGNFGADSELSALYQYGALMQQDPNTVLGLNIDFQQKISNIIAPITSGVSNLIDGVSTYGPSMIDALSLIKAIQSGQPLPEVASGLRVANDISKMTSSTTNYALDGAASVGSGILSLMSLDAALKRGDVIGATNAGLQTVNFAATAYADFAASAGASAGIATEISQTLMGTGTNALGLTNGVLPYVGLVAAIASGDETSIAIAAISLIPGMQVVGIAYAVFSMVESLFGGSDKIPDPWGTGHYTWDGNSISYQSAGETGGNEAVSNVMQSVLNAMNSIIEQQRQTNPTSALGIIPNRMPTIAYDMSGYRYTDIDPLTGVQLDPSLRFDTSGKPYNATSGTPESYYSIGEAIIRSALSRGAIAPMWEVNTAKMQTDAGDPEAGLTEEARAGQNGQLAAAVTGDTQTFRPVVLDLNGDGIHTIDKSVSGVNFDVDNSGFLKQTAWIDGQDAFLTLDRNYNGTVDSGKEMFSNSAVALGSRGLAGMAWVDANYDGKLTSSDPVWNELKVWQDANSDGQQEDGETHILSEMGISELNYAMGTFTQNGVVKQLASEDLTADTKGVIVNVVQNGILVQSSDGNTSLIVSRVDDMTSVQANQDGINGREDSETIVGSTILLANDTLGGISGRELSLTNVENFQHGSGYMDVNGFVHFSPDANYFGNDAGFDYTTTAASNGQTGIGHVQIIVQPVNDVPSGADIQLDKRAIYGYIPSYYDYDSGYTYGGEAIYTPYTDESGVVHNTPIGYDEAGTGKVIGIDVDDAPDTLKYELLGDPQYGAVTLNADGTFQYTPWSSPNTPTTEVHTLDGEIKDDAFDVKITDPSGLSITQTVHVQHYGSYTPPTPPGGGGGGGCWPIAIDLDRNGFDFTDVANSNIFFDINGDGWKRKVSWTSAGDGWLAYDANSNGKVDDGSEIVFTKYAHNAQTDLAALAETFDTNHDGMFTSADDKWAKFGIWNDKNQNGISDDGEFKTLSDMGVASISLVSDNQFSVNNGNTIHGISKVTMSDGSVLDAADVTLAYSNAVQVNNQNGTTSVVNQAPFAPSGQTIEGTDDKDLLLGTNGNNVINAHAGDDVIFDNEGNDVIDAGDGNDIVYSGGGNDLVMAGAGDDMVYAGLGDDMIFGGDGNDVIFAEGGNDVVFGGNGNDMISGGGGNDVLSGDAGDDQLYGEAGNDVLFGRDGNDQLFGMDGNDLLDGGAGNDLLDGGTGADDMRGGTGDDTYVVDNVVDTITELVNEGTDTVIASISYTIGDNLENLTLSGSDNLSGTGNALDNYIIGNLGDNLLIGGEGNDTLDGGMGADTMIGGKGDDTYIVDNVNDVVIEAANEGNDTIRTSVSYTLSDNVETLILTGSSDTTATGNALDNTLIGNSGNNTLDGGAGADIMIGGKGDDTYIVDNGNDVVTENVNEGIDTIRTNLSWTLGANIENLILTGSDNTNATGNELSNILIGNSGNNVLDGKGGADAMASGLGDDTYIVDNIGDIVYEAQNGGNDQVIASVSYTLSDNVEKLTLSGVDDINATGNALDNTLIGNSGNNVLDGGAGADVMIGGAGNDTYIVDNTGDTVIENANEGIDTVKSSISWHLGNNLENLVLSGTDAINATGNELDNVLECNSADNTLDGGIGADMMIGGLGNDTYVVDNVNDVIVEAANEGVDTILSSVSYILSSNVEAMVLTGTDAINATGNELDNTLIGNSSNNTLDGGIGADTMIGGKGDDTYIVDSVNDSVIEVANEGYDTVHSSVSYALSANVEAMVLTGTDNINATGNELNNTLIGNSGNNVLDGKGGADTMIGGLGNDTYIVDNAQDTVVEDLNAGIDTIMSTVSYVLPSNVENLTLMGTDSINATGNTQDNILNGNDADNILSGGEGNDRLVGNGGNDTLDGGSGADVMIGGTGNDIYYVDNVGDVVQEAANGGYDTIRSSISITLPQFVERLELLGNDNLSATGNELDNTLIGNSGDNVLDGGTGADIMVGGAGNDTYIVDNVGDVVTENADAEYDTVRSSITYALTDNVEALTLTGTNNINGTGNALNNTLIGNSGNNTLDGGTCIDTMIGGKGDDNYVVDNSADNVIELSDEGLDTVYTSVSYVLPENVENLILTGNGDISSSGNSSDNTLIGNSGNNLISGGAGNDILDGKGGNDTLDGGSGNDTLIGGTGNDMLIGGTGNDTYLINLGDGLDTIVDTQGTDTVKFTAGMSLDTVALRVVSINGVLTAQVRVLNAGGCEQADQGFDFAITTDSKGKYVSPIEQFTFSDGSVKTFDDLLIKTQVTYGSIWQTTITTGRNDDIIYAGPLNNIIHSGSGNDIVYAGSGGDKVYGEGGNDLLEGGCGNDMLDGGCGVDILEGGNGNDTLNDMYGNNLLFGGSQNDTITAGSGNDFIAGGMQNDTLSGGSGYNIFAFNGNDGRDAILPSAGAHNTLSLADINKKDLSLQKVGGDLVLNAGCNSQITFKGWYDSSANQNFDTLQVISEDQNGPHHSAEFMVDTFDFHALVSAFDTARSTNSRLNQWSAMNSLLTTHLTSSNTMALGGDLAVNYANNGDFSGMTLATAQSTLKDPAFGANAQTFQPLSNKFC